jgi:glycosyltransferase involved in cell wall biosynthesis
MMLEQNSQRNQNKPIKVGVLAYRMDFYTNQRLIVGKLPQAKYVPARDWYSFQRWLALKVNRVLGKPLINTFNLNNQFEDFDLNRVDVLHFSNGISYGRTPWVSSFETILPRFSHLVTRHQGKEKPELRLDEHTRRGLEAMAGKACLRILAWSQASARMERDLLADFPSEFTQAILDKMQVLHPPQAPLVEAVEPRGYRSEPLRFMLVGAAFFRKGGREILQAFEKLVRQEGLPLRLIIVSSLRLEPYAAHETEADVEWAKQKLSDNADWIEYYPQLPNAEVLELLKRADVGLLPSYADTYGLSVLEAQACGKPVITTDIRALPEINPETAGWLIKVPKNELGEALYTTVEERAELNQAIQTGLEVIVRSIVDDPDQIAIKGAAALKRIREKHDPQMYAEVLRQIYQLGLK